MSVRSAERTMVFVLSVVLYALGSQVVAGGESTKAEEAQALFDRGMQAFFADDPQTAIEHFREALQVDPDFLDAHWMLIWHGPKKEKNSHCEVIITLDPYSEQAYVAKRLLDGKSVPVYGHPKTWRFHLPSCVGLPLDRMIRFRSAEEAVVAWYEGCPYCNSDPKNLLAAQQADHREMDERFDRVMEHLQRSIGQQVAAARTYSAEADHHLDDAKKLINAAQVKEIVTGPIALGGEEAIQLVTDKTVVPEAARGAVCLLSRQERLMLPNWGQYDRQEGSKLTFCR